MIEVSQISAGYDGKKVIRNISFTLADRQNLCILGPNGCGKTTLLRAIASLIPFEGSVKIDGVPASLMGRRQLASKIAVMGQISNVYFSYTVYETVMLGRYQHLKRGLFREASRADREYAEKCLEVVGLQDIRHAQINTLSGGQLQRVFLARTLAQEPQIILLDEPTNHLDLRYQVEFISYLKEWSEDDKHSVIGVFHDLNLALNLSENLLVIKNGELAGSGDYRSFFTADFLKGVYGMDVAGYMTDAYSRWSNL